jgi:hypothetical protein
MEKKKQSTQSALNAFLKDVATKEAGKKSVSIGNIRETLKVVNDLLDGDVYKLIDKKYNNIEGGEFDDDTLKL